MCVETNFLTWVFLIHKKPRTINIPFHFFIIYFTKNAQITISKYHFQEPRDQILGFRILSISQDTPLLRCAFSCVRSFKRDRHHHS